MSKKNIDNETKEIIDSFVAEGFDMLENVEGIISNLSSDYDKEIINTIFRLFHSLKGTAGFLNFKNIKEVTHEAETLLDLFRKNEIKPDHEIIEVIYRTLDFIRQIIKNVEEELTDTGFENHAEIIINSIGQSIKNVKQEIDNNIVEDKDQEPGKSSNTDNNIEDYKNKTTELLLLGEKHITEFKNNKTNIKLLKNVQENIKIIKEKSKIYNKTTIQRLCINFINILNQMSVSQKNITDRSIDGLLNIIGLLKNSINDISSEDTGNSINEPEEHNKLLGEILVDMGIVSEEIIEKAINIQDYNQLGQILVQLGETSNEQIEKALKIQIKNEPGTIKTSFDSLNRRDIRVDSKKLDLLFDTIGELITNGVMLTNNPDLEGLQLNNFRKVSNSFNKITKELQEITMSLRMIPIETLFIKMKRLVWDLSRKSGKKINLIIKGQDTEVDRNIIQQLSNPLVHLIRNSIDHGIENQDEREKNNKNPEGTIIISAKYESNEIWISVNDDGRGLNREKIINKAIEKGFITNGMNLTDKEVYEFILKPGFSTAVNISDISGRGVGMDVVSRNIENLNGTIDISSSQGKGTSITLKIPLTLAIMEAITVKTGNNIYSIPTIDIHEFFKANPKQIIKTDNKNEVINLRGEIIPIIKLFEIFNINTKITEITNGIIVVISYYDYKACLLVDEIIGSYQVVIKPLSDYFEHTNSISGCAIMGNGEVSLIIDTGSVLKNYFN